MAVGPLSKGAPQSIGVSGGRGGKLGYFIYEGNGAGGFSKPQFVSLPNRGTFGVAIADIDGDGFADLISDEGYVAFGTAGGKFKPAVLYPVVNTFVAYNVVLADLRKNGPLDVVTNNHDGNSVLLNQGKGLFEDGLWTPVTGGAGCGAAADYNSDGKPDLAVNTASGISILLGTGKYARPFTTGTPVSLPNAGCLVTGDINGDGIPDLVVPVNDTVVAYLGKGDGTFTFASTTATPSGGFVVLGDFNNDGKLDFITSGNLLALGNGDGTFQAPTPFVSNPPSGGFSNIAVGDINNDGWPDAVLTNADVPHANLYVLLNNQSGGFTQVPSNIGDLTTQAVLADLNGDGNLDLVLSYLGGGAGGYFGDGTGQFTPGPGFALPLYLQGIALVADLNGDGIPDVAVLPGETVGIFLGTGGRHLRVTARLHRHEPVARRLPHDGSARAVTILWPARHRGARYFRGRHGANQQGRQHLQPPLPILLPHTARSPAALPGCQIAYALPRQRPTCPRRADPPGIHPHRP